MAMAALGIGQFGAPIALLNFGLQGAAPAVLVFSLFPRPSRLPRRRWAASESPGRCWPAWC